MAIQAILKIGDPRLRQICGEVREFGTPALRTLVNDMFDTMRAADGAGLAAIQIGVHLRVVIFGFTHNPRYPEAEPVPETILINPVITPLGTATGEAWEGCLSVPGMRGLVTRYREIRYTGFDPEGKPIDRCVDGFHARVVQHECDHLDGILYPERIVDLRNFGFTEELDKNGLLGDGTLPCETGLQDKQA